MRGGLDIGAAAAVLSILIAGCASVSPDPSATAIELRPGSGAVLRGARAVWIGAASSRSGGAASSHAVDAAAGRTAIGGGPEGAIDGGASVGSGDVEDVSESLRVTVLGARGLELAATRDQADLVLYFEQADRLPCWACRQAEGVWQWWGLIRDNSGREVGSLHGETASGAEAARRQFVAGVKKLVRQARRRSSGGPTR